MDGRGRPGSHGWARPARVARRDARVPWARGGRRITAPRDWYGNAGGNGRPLLAWTNDFTLGARASDRSWVPETG